MLNFTIFLSFIKAVFRMFVGDLGLSKFEEKTMSMSKILEKVDFVTIDKSVSQHGLDVVVAAAVAVAVAVVLMVAAVVVAAAVAVVVVGVLMVAAVVAIICVTVDVVFKMMLLI